MQFKIIKIAFNVGASCFVAVSFLIASFDLAYADNTKNTSKVAQKSKQTNKSNYTEDQFLNEFSGKMKSVVIAKLGEPIKKESSVKPAGAGSFLQKAGADEKNSKRVNVEMWYYKDIVNYDAKNKYKETEITLVNDKVMNIAFFNNR